jgi:formate-dependent nitrite reductase membrane component NrfD
VERRSREGHVTQSPGGYFGRSPLKPPPWTWEVPLYLFVGGLAGAAAVLAFAGRAGGAAPAAVRAALWLAAGGAALSAALLVSDLGRPARFLNMLRVLKWRSPMSVGVWLLAAFGAAAAVALAAGQGGAASWVPLAAAALLGSVVATYTGVLLAVTVVPAWNAHASALPLHFGAAALGSAAAALELLGHRLDALHVLGIAAAAVETAVFVWLESRRGEPRDRALREGPSGLLVRASGALAGPVALVLRLAGLRAPAALAFLAGALAARFGWIAAGRASAEDPRAAG